MINSIIIYVQEFSKLPPKELFFYSSSFASIFAMIITVIAFIKMRGFQKTRIQEREAFENIISPTSVSHRFKEIDNDIGKLINLYYDHNMMKLESNDFIIKRCYEIRVKIIEANKDLDTFLGFYNDKSSPDLFDTPLKAAKFYKFNGNIDVAIKHYNIALKSSLPKDEKYECYQGLQECYVKRGNQEATKGITEKAENEGFKLFISARRLPTPFYFRYLYISFQVDNLFDNIFKKMNTFNRKKKVP